MFEWLYKIIWKNQTEAVEKFIIEEPEIFEDETNIQQIFAAQIAQIKDKAKYVVSQQISYLDIANLEKKAIDRVRNLSSYEDATRSIKIKTSGIIPLLETGEITYLLYANLLKEKHIASSLMQSFGSATEIMIHVSFVLFADNTKLKEFIDNNRDCVKPKDRKPVYYWIGILDNKALKSILHDYKNMRNLAAHTYQLLPIEAAQSFIFRTFENIQRLELIINPD